MSYSFTVTAPQFLKPKELLGAIQDSNVHILDEYAEDEDWPEGKYYHFYRDQVSTRGVECGRYEQGIQVRLMSCSNAADYELAHLILQKISGEQSEIESEEEEKVSVLELDSIFTEAWRNSQMESGPRVVSSIVKKDQTVLTIPGLLRDAHFGPRLIAELEEGSPENFTERFLEKLREIRYTEAGDYFQASILSAKAPGAEKAMNFAVWAEGVAYLFPNVEYLAIRADEKEVFFVPRDKLQELSPRRPRYVDEVQCFVDAVPESDWPALVARARMYKLEKPPQSTVESASKKWWQFWK